MRCQHTVVPVLVVYVLYYIKTALLHHSGSPYPILEKFKADVTSPTASPIREGSDERRNGAGSPVTSHPDNESVIECLPRSQGFRFL